MVVSKTNVCWWLDSKVDSQILRLLQDIEHLENFLRKFLADNSADVSLNPLLVKSLVESVEVH